jgi:hypothetical protein
MASRRASGVALCIDKRHQSHSCQNRKQQSSENQEELMMVYADSLKLLLRELGASPLAGDIACLALPKDSSEFIRRGCQIS